MRTPKLPKSIPKALSVEDAGEAIDKIAVLTHESWLALRDVAILTLLYGCGLRIGEALALKRHEAPEGDAMRVEICGCVVAEELGIAEDEAGLVEVVGVPGEEWQQG